MANGGAGLAVRVLTPDRGGAWRDGWLDSGSGQVLVERRPVPEDRIRGVQHDSARQVPHQPPMDPVDAGWLVLMATVYWPEVREKIECYVGWRSEETGRRIPFAVTSSNGGRALATAGG